LRTRATSRGGAANRTGSASAHIEQAQPGQAQLLQQNPFEVLLFQHRQLIGRHLAAIGPQLTIELAAGFEQLFLTLAAFGDREHLLFENRETLLQRLQILIMLLDFGAEFLERRGDLMKLSRQCCRVAQKIIA